MMILVIQIAYRGFLVCFVCRDFFTLVQLYSFAWPKSAVSRYNSGMNNIPEWVSLVILPLIVWSAFWKVLALWHAARRSDAVWFIVLLFLNTLGILEIIYLYKSGKFKSGQLFPKQN